MIFKRTTAPILRFATQRLLVQDVDLLLLHDGVLVVHAAAEGALDLGAEGELGEVLALLGAGDEALLGEVLVVEAVEAVGDVGDFDAAALGGDGRRVGGEGGRGRVGRHADGGALGGELRRGNVSMEKVRARARGGRNVSWGRNGTYAGRHDGSF